MELSRSVYIYTERDRKEKSLERDMERAEKGKEVRGKKRRKENNVTR